MLILWMMGGFGLGVLFTLTVLALGGFIDWPWE